jgi:hypothetical protein
VLLRRNRQRLGAVLGACLAVGTLAGCNAPAVDHGASYRLISTVGTVEIAVPGDSLNHLTTLTAGASIAGSGSAGVVSVALAFRAGHLVALAVIPKLAEIDLGTIEVGASSTAQALVFLTPGVSTSEPVGAAARLGATRDAGSFPALTAEVDRLQHAGDHWFETAAMSQPLLQDLAATIAETTGALNTAMRQIDVPAVPAQETFARVPDETGRTPSTAAQDLALHGFNPVVVDDATSTAPAGTLTGTGPAANQRARLGSDVEVLVSRAPPPIAVPDVRGVTVDQAMSLLRSAQLVAVVQPTPVSDRTQIGIVISQRPQPGELVAIGWAVTIDVGQYCSPADGCATTTSTSTSTTSSTTTSTSTTTTTSSPAPGLSGANRTIAATFDESPGTVDLVRVSSEPSCDRNPFNAVGSTEGLCLTNDHGKLRYTNHGVRWVLVDTNSHHDNPYPMPPATVNELSFLKGVLKTAGSFFTFVAHGLPHVSLSTVRTALHRAFSHASQNFANTASASVDLSSTDHDWQTATVGLSDTHHATRVIEATLLTVFTQYVFPLAKYVGLAGVIDQPKAIADTLLARYETDSKLREDSNQLFATGFGRHNISGLWHVVNDLATAQTLSIFLKNELPLPDTPLDLLTTLADALPGVSTIHDATDLVLRGTEFALLISNITTLHTTGEHTRT